MKRLIFLSFLLASTTALFSQASPIGIWKTIDDKTGEAKSHVEVYEQNDQVYGKIVKLLLKAPDTVCEKCPGAKKNKPVLGMVIIDGLKSYKHYWRKGDILDPESGDLYSCSIWFEEDQPDELKVRGKHWTGLYRTQTWYRVK